MFEWTIINSWDSVHQDFMVETLANQLPIHY